MAFIEISNDGTLNGTTPVVIVPAPIVSTRSIIKNITIQNSDATTVTLRIYLKNSSNIRIIWEGTLDFGDTWSFGDGDICVLDSVNKSIEAVLSTSPSIQPTFISAWGNAT